MARGRKTGGRLKGSKNKRTLERERATQEAASKISASIKGAFEGDAHELLMAVYKDPDQPWHVRIDAAKAALPYEKARIAAAQKKPEPIAFNTLPSARERISARLEEMAQRLQRNATRSLASPMADLALAANSADQE